MAVFSAILVPAGTSATKVASLGASTSSAEQVLGPTVIFAINADQDITIKFGQSGMAAASATDFRIPANQTLTFDLGQAFDRVRVFNVSASSANIYIQPLSRF